MSERRQVHDTVTGRFVSPEAAETDPAGTMEVTARFGPLEHVVREVVDVGEQMIHDARGADYRPGAHELLSWAYAPMSGAARDLRLNHGSLARTDLVRAAAFLVRAIDALDEEDASGGGA